MRTLFISNYFNHHQRSLSDNLNTGCENYKFISVSKMRKEREILGYGENTYPEYVKSYEEFAQSQEEIQDADIVILGAAPVKMIKDRIRRGKLTFKYGERPIKKQTNWVRNFARFLKWHLQYPAIKPAYLLCASAYASSDYGKYGVFHNKSYKWGYFPETRKYEIDALMQKKRKNTILWCGRFLEWKHPEAALEVAMRLKKDGYDFEIELIGTGELETQLKEQVSQYNLQEYVRFAGAMKPDEVRTHMEKSAIYLFTSDYQEGWGAVVNEAMNSGCAVVASHAAGAVPYLIRNKENGLIYRSGDIEMLYEKVCYLLEHPKEQVHMGKAAYRTITEVWNAEVAAERFLTLAKHILMGEESPQLYEEGPCSKAERIKDDWFYG